mmetsp:Transcript_7672/g.13460  ORF Transcript_7672/g.13460 Transcript_7672/m.13460 type:complete len:247 (+) Transcript_7672:26-766(+)
MSEELLIYTAFPGLNARMVKTTKMALLQQFWFAALLRPFSSSTTGSLEKLPDKVGATLGPDENEEGSLVLVSESTTGVLFVCAVGISVDLATVGSAEAVVCCCVGATVSVTAGAMVDATGETLGSPVDTLGSKAFEGCCVGMAVSVDVGLLGAIVDVTGDILGSLVDTLEIDGADVGDDVFGGPSLCTVVANFWVRQSPEVHLHRTDGHSFSVSKLKHASRSLQVAPAQLHWAFALHAASSRLSLH